MTFDARETSTQDAQPIELYTFVAPSATYRFTSHDEDVTFDGQTYTALPDSRGNVTIVPVGSVRELPITLPVDHELVLLAINNGLPPRDITVTIAKYHSGDAEDRQIWKGFIGGVETDGQYARLRIPNATDEAFARRLPVVVAQRTCNHMLYDTGCAIERIAALKIEPTVASVSGVDLVVSSISAKPDQWARHGEVKRVSDGERRSILAQVGTAITIDVPFGTLDVGDALEVWQGCDHSPEVCRDDFANIVNFGGHVEMPSENPTAPNGFGVVVQE